MAGETYRALAEAAQQVSGSIAVNRTAGASTRKGAGASGRSSGSNRSSTKSVKVRKILFLDVDGVLTTARSRPTSPETFDPRAVVAMERLLKEAEPNRIVMHSSWRKLPKPPAPPWTFPSPTWWWYFSRSWWRKLCQFHGATTLAATPLELAKYKMSSTRGEEVSFWLTEHGAPDDRYVVLDDEIGYFRNVDDDRVLLVSTDDATGLTDAQVDEILEWW